ncbi:hypothetical protein D3C76_1705610 [compost metagenome]
MIGRIGRFNKHLQPECSSTDTEMAVLAPVAEIGDFREPHALQQCLPAYERAGSEAADLIQTGPAQLRIELLYLTPALLGRWLLAPD